MSDSQLYTGFRYAGSLPSIRCQRQVQAHVLSSLAPRSILVIGCAYGDELRQLISRVDIEDPRLTVTATDLCDVEAELREHQFARDLGSRLRWARINLLDSEQLPGYGHFDLVQCGFVLHDIPWELKDRAMEILAGAPHRRGHVLISEIFVVGSSGYASQVTEIYDGFLREAHASLTSGALEEHCWRLLVGDGQSPGLLRSKEQAVCGSRDFFETLPSLLGRAKGCSLKERRVIRNKVNDRLAVALLRSRDGFPADSCTTIIRGGTDVQ